MVKLENLSTNYLLNLIEANEKEIEELTLQNIGFNSVLSERQNK